MKKGEIKKIKQNNQKGERIIDWGSKRFDIGKIPPRCDLHQMVKGNAFDPDNDKRACLHCEYYTKSLKTKKCSECLQTKHLDNFEIDHFLKGDEKWKWLVDGV